LRPCGLDQQKKGHRHQGMGQVEVTCSKAGLG
jgi:hypothetical protein